MAVSSKKLLAGLAAIAVTGALFMGFLMTGTAQGQPPTCSLDEDFSGSFPPSGWTTDDWMQSFSNQAGGISPEALLPWSGTGLYAHLDSNSVDTTGAPSLTLEFKSFVDDYSGIGSYNCSVYTRTNGADTWSAVTPWSNPIYGNVGPNTYSVDISSDIGSATQVRFEFDGQSNDLDCWYVDDVKFCYPTPPPVGGEAHLVSKASVLAPWVAAALLLAGGISWYALRRHRAQS